MSITQSYFLYYFIVIITTLIALLSEKMGNNIKYKRIIFWGAVIIPIIFSSLRYGVGTDYFNYERMYYTLTSQGDLLSQIINSRIEPGWIMLNYIVKMIFDDVKYVFILSSLLIWIFNFKAIYDNRSRVSIGVAVFIMLTTLFNPSFNIIRQSLAAAILMLSINPIIEKRQFKFLWIVLFATLFHYTAIIFLPMYWIINTKVKKIGLIKKVITFAIAILLVIFAPGLLEFVTQFESFEYYSHYELSLGNLGLGNILIKSPIIIIMLLNIKKVKLSNPIYKLMIIYFLGLVLEYYGYYANYVNRIAIYFNMAQIFILAAIIKVQSNKYERLFYGSLLIIYFLAWFTYYFIYLNRNDTIPYMWLN